jgi:hypothetical protein
MAESFARPNRHHDAPPKNLTQPNESNSNSTQRKEDDSIQPTKSNPTKKNTRTNNLIHKTNPPKLSSLDPTKRTIKTRQEGKSLNESKIPAQNKRKP